LSPSYRRSFQIQRRGIRFRCNNTHGGRLELRDREQSIDVAAENTADMNCVVVYGASSPSSVDGCTEAVLGYLRMRSVRRLLWELATGAFSMEK